MISLNIYDTAMKYHSLGRSTAIVVVRLLVVVEPGQRSIDTATHVKKLASEIGLTSISLVGNKIRGEQDEVFLKNQ